MDVKELMMFKPSQTPKRPNPSDPSKSQEDVEEDTGDSYEARAKKRKLALKKAQEVRLRTRLPLSCEHVAQWLFRSPTGRRRRRGWPRWRRTPGRPSSPAAGTGTCPPRRERRYSRSWSRSQSHLPVSDLIFTLYIKGR